MQYLIILAVGLVIAGSITLAIHLSRMKAQHLLAQQPDLGLLGLKQAIQLVWIEELGMRMEDLPRITWVVGALLNCYNGRGWKDRNGQCVAGESWQPIHTCSVAWVPGMLLSDTALVHELLHAMSWITGTFLDHFAPEFQNEVARLNGKLREAGL